MIHWDVVNDLYKMAKEKAPDLTDDQHFEIAILAYREIEYKVLMSPSDPVGITDIDFGSPLNDITECSGILSKYKAT